VRGVVWVGGQVQDAAEREYYDEGRIRRQLLDLEDDLEAGRISEDEYELIEDELVGRLLEAQRWAAGEPIEDRTTPPGQTTLAEQAALPEQTAPSEQTPLPEQTAPPEKPAEHDKPLAPQPAQQIATRGR